ncbi:hypothetical protein J2S40_002867 [Nocardioides luteus]|uniref:Uncharacterized protein n=1 Tax=Nocardioides luteus TaxID=1844 RepID=A0ABQ5SV34_9ACTN|nr:hypothetical protein [Nocardioides luteus]MDR7311809.1 hypothetical protein [Nocardioides luteus]GGR71747.1 hypothetical protein GCM10010197_44010 [Nocardioides luteus]GLJ68052.1 hypothetical protein GCM10017579_20880 [Nocardioides luteus]
MRLFAWVGRTRASAPPETRDLTPEQRAALPERFEAVAEALAERSSYVAEACWVLGLDLADSGVSLGEGLEDLRLTTQTVEQRDPVFTEMHALSVAWSEATLGYLHTISCADPLTGLATLAHLRERISDLYREATARSHALVITDAHLPGAPGSKIDNIATARRMSLLGQTARSVFAGAAAVGQIGHSRMVVVAPRDETLVRRLGLLRRMVEHSADRIWIEGLPENDTSAGFLLDELARGA